MSPSICCLFEISRALVRDENMPGNWGHVGIFLSCINTSHAFQRLELLSLVHTHKKKLLNCKNVRAEQTKSFLFSGRCVMMQQTTDKGWNPTEPVLSHCTCLSIAWQGRWWSMELRSCQPWGTEWKVTFALCWKLLNREAGITETMPTKHTGSEFRISDGSTC